MLIARQSIRDCEGTVIDLLLRLRRGGQRERERLLRALNTGDLLRHLRGQLIAGSRLVAVLERNG